MENGQVQPELASGMRTIPPAGMMLIQQPGRVTLDKLICFSDFNSVICGKFPRLKIHAADAEMVPQPKPPRDHFQFLSISPVRRPYARSDVYTVSPTIAGCWSC